MAKQKCESNATTARVKTRDRATGDRATNGQRQTGNFHPPQNVFNFLEPNIFRDIFRDICNLFAPARRTSCLSIPSAWRSASRRSS